MATKPPVSCPVCEETIPPEDDLEGHLLHEHRPPELARQIVSQWEAEELGDEL